MYFYVQWNWKRDCNWGFENQSNVIREIGPSAKPRNVYSEWHNSRTAFNESIQTTGPDGVKSDDYFFLVVGVTPYMKKVTEGLQLSYPKLMLGLQCMLSTGSRKRFVSLIQTQTCWLSVERKSLCSRQLEHRPLKIKLTTHHSPKSSNAHRGTWLDVVRFRQ